MISIRPSYDWTGRGAMARMRALLSDIDRVSAGDVVYPRGGRLGPCWQRDVQLVLVHAGSARVTVDDMPRARVGAGWIGLLLPGHRERFEFSDAEPTHHSWVQAHVVDAPHRWHSNAQVEH